MKIQASNPHSHNGHLNNDRAIHDHGSSPGSRLVRLTPSRYLWVIVLVTHFLAIFAVYLTSLLNVWQLLLIITITSSLIYACVQCALQPLFRLHRRQDGWYLITEKIPVLPSSQYLRRWSYTFGFWCAGDVYRVVSGSYISTFVVVLRIEDKHGQQRHLPIFSDCCQRGDFRWLRVVVKYLL